VSPADRPASPLRDRRFALLWSCVAAAYLAQWMLPVAAQWFLVERPGGKTLVPYVQVALTLPMALLAIPAGVLADRFDRRKLVITVQIIVLIAEVALVWLTLSGGLQPWSLFALLAVMAMGIVTTFNSLSSMVPELVDTKAIPAASALLTIATNGTRVIGPALAGFILASASIGVAFAAAIPATALLLVVLTRLRAPSAGDRADEGWLAAAAVGVRFVRHSPQALKLIARTFWFTSGVMAVLAMLPVLATRLGADATALGMVLAAQGVGAVIGALTLPRLAWNAEPNSIVAAGMLVAASGLALGAVAPNLALLAIATMLAGWAWTTVLATNQAGMQMYLPAWVRARGLSVMMIATFAGQAIGSALFGWTATVTSLAWTLGIAAVFMLGGVALAFVIPLKNLDHIDRSAVPGWLETEFVLTPQEAQRPLQVRMCYDIPFSKESEFLDLMAHLRLIRLRTGARRWQLLADPESDGRYYEEYMVASWIDHEMQIRMRGTAHDRQMDSQAKGMSREEPVITYSFRVGVPGVAAMRR
jgi:MFS family permease